MSLVLGAGLLAACSGSNEVSPFTEPDGATGAHDAHPFPDGATTDDGATDDDSTTSEDGATDDGRTPTAPDAEAGPGGPLDASFDGPRNDAAPDATLDAAPDATLDAAPDAAPDASPDAGPDAGRDASPDAGLDAGPRDAAADAPVCPIATAAGNSYVNAAEGVDDTSHGGGPGACAYETITYALTRAKANIVVAAGTYSANSGETLPFVLTGKQAITCNSATVSGQGHYQSTRATIVFSGAANVLNGCTLVGDDQGGACVLVSSSTNIGHTIQSVHASHCGDAAVRVEATLVEIDGSSFSSNNYGISWSNASTGYMANDAYSKNAAVDIACDPGDPDPGVAGVNNNDGTGDATCSGCGNCPFP